MKKTMSKQQQLELLDKQIEELQAVKSTSFLTNGEFQFSSSVRVDLKSAHNEAIIIKMMSAIIQWKDSHEKACIVLERKTPFKFSGYTADEWSHDFKAQLAHLDRQDRLSKFISLRQSLVALMTKEEKAITIMDEITKALNV